MDVNFKKARVLKIYPWVQNFRLSVSEGVLLDFLLLSDSARARVVLGGEDELVSKALSESLDGSHGLLSGTQADLENTDRDSSEGGNVHRLSLGSTTTSDSGTVFSWTSVSDGVDDNLRY